MRHRAAVFMMHREMRPEDGIGGHTLEETRWALRRLRASGANFKSLSELVDCAARTGEFPPDSVAFTIDDGFADQARLAQVFQEEGVPVTIFLITGFLDGLTWPWDDRVALAVRESPLQTARIELPDGEWSHSLSSPGSRRLAVQSLQARLKSVPQDGFEELLRPVFASLQVRVPESPPPSHAPLTWSQARELESAGVDFGPHSVTHRIFSRLSDDAASEEIAGSWRRLRQELRRPLDIFAWPTGRPSDFTARDQHLARDSGLRACFATGDDYSLAGPGAGSDALFGLKRFALPHSERYLLKYSSWIERAKQVVRRPFNGGRE